MKLKRKIKTKYIISVLLIIVIILLFGYGNIISKNMKYKKFARENEENYEKNKEQVFKVEKIVICSSANAVDLSQKQNLQNMSIYQFTDIAVYINNGDELSNKNTVKKLYVDNISLEGTDTIGNKSLNYKNILKFGQKKDTITKKEEQSSDVFAKLMNKNKKQEDESKLSDEPIDVGSIDVNENLSNSNQIEENTNEKIDFNIVYTNEQNDNANYDEPTFYTDCSNPITLEYINNDIVTNYKMDENKSVSFDGTILKEAGISAEDLACKVRFKINIINNDNEKYSCWINFEIPLDDVFQGTTMKAKTTNGQKYVFFRE